MRLQVRLTLWSILVMLVVVSSVSALDMIGEINNQFELVVKRSQPIKQFAIGAVKRALERTRRPSAEDSVRDDEVLTDQLVQMLTEGQAMVEIAVCDLQDNILNASDSDRIGSKLPRSDPFEEFVKKSRWWEKLRVLLYGERTYEVTEDLLNAQGQPEQRIHIVYDPALMRTGPESIFPVLKGHLRVAAASIFGGVVAVLILSATAFRPLGKLGEMLDLLARGEYEMQPVTPGSDQFGLVASKVKILGDVLKGRQYEISDLKGNVEQILNEMDDAVLIFGRDRRLIAAAGTIEKFLGRPRSELIGQPLTEIFPQGTTLGLMLSQSIQTTRPIRNRRLPLQHAEHEALSMALLSVEFLEASGGGLVIRLRDPEATRQIGRHLQTADRLSAISRLTGGVAHEVKNPLNAILMHVELAKMKLNHGDYDLQPQMEVISSEILRLDRVVKTFLDFTKPVELHATDTNLKGLVQEIADLAAPQAAGSGIELSIRQSEEPTTVTVDSDLIKQAILNIVVNAIEAMSQNGDGTGHLRIESNVRGDTAEIRVADTGPGIPPELREKIYNLYFTTKTHGSGIGLAMTFQIVQLHDGTIEVASEPGKGTIFTIRLPASVVTA
jgi:signal transduction histidine kinase